MKAARFTADEIERVSYLTTKGYLPVAVDEHQESFRYAITIVTFPRPNSVSFKEVTTNL